MLKILKRIGRLIAGVSNDAVDAIEDGNPGLAARQITRELSEKIDQVEAAELEVNGEYIRLCKLRDAAQAEVTQWAESAKKAVHAGVDDDLARKCLVRKRNAHTKVNDLTKQIEQIKPSVERLKKEADRLRSQRDQQAGRSDMLSARASVANAQETAAQIVGGIGVCSEFAAMDDLEDRVARREAHAQAAMELAEEKSGEDITRQLEALDQHDGIDDELAQLKAAVADEHAAGAA